jgi:hypothetical protein
MGPTVVCFAARARAAALARAAAPAWQVTSVALPDARRATAAADAVIERALRSAVADAVIIWPTLSAPVRSRNPPLAVWRQRRDAVLRATYLAARAGGLALRARGGGRLLVVIDPAAADDLVGAVLADALHGLADAVRKALVPSVEVCVLRLAAGAAPRRRASPPAVARPAVTHLCHWLAEPGTRSIALSAPHRRARTRG